MTDMQVLALLGAGVALVGGLWAASWIWRKQRYSTLALLFVAAGPVLALLAYLSVVDVRLKDMATAGLLAGGLLMGLMAAPLAELRRQPPAPGKRRGSIRMSFAAWLPLPGALAVAALQVSAAAGSATALVFSLAALEAVAGFGVGASLALLLRRIFLKRLAGPASGASATTAPPPEEAPAPATATATAGSPATIPAASPEAPVE